MFITVSIITIIVIITIITGAERAVEGGRSRLDRDERTRAPISPVLFGANLALEGV